MFGTSLAARFESYINGDTATLFSALVRIAEAKELVLYLVGGSVRDLVLERANIDVDIATESDAISLAETVAAETGVACKIHRAFGTARLLISEAYLDLATARSETYPQPGSLPRVQPVTQSEDLGRRDFTINAMALTLTGPEKGRLIDNHGGLADIARETIRVLHDASFIDDSTRILRAIRYASRLGFDIEPHTLSLVQRDKHYLATVNQPRLRLEFRRVLDEEEPERALSRCEELGVLREIHSDLSFGNSQAAAFAAARREIDSSSAVYYTLLALTLSAPQAASLADRLATTLMQRMAMEAVPLARDLVDGWASDVRPSQAAKALRMYPEQSLWALALAAPEARAREISRQYLQTWRHVRASLNGRDVQRLGIPKGPTVGAVMEQIMDGLLDGRLQSREDEVHFVEKTVHNYQRQGEYRLNE